MSFWIQTGVCCSLLFLLVGVSNLAKGDHCTFLEGLHPREQRFHGHIDVTHLHYAREVEDFVEERSNLRELFRSSELLVRFGPLSRGSSLPTGWAAWVSLALGRVLHLIILARGRLARGFFQDW